MSKTEYEQQWQVLASIISRYQEGAGLQTILDELKETIPKRTLQYRLKRYVEAGRLRQTGKSRGTRYYLDSENVQQDQGEEAREASTQFPYSITALTVLSRIRQPLFKRKPIGYQFAFLDSYRPNTSHYLNATEKKHLLGLGTGMPEEPAGTFARQLLNRLLIDLSWNSSRLEGNTYSLLDTRRLLRFGAEAEGKASLEAQMILNHKEAIEFLVENAADIGFDRYTLLNLHGLLSNNLLPDPQASGRLRTLTVGIGQSTFQPLDVPQLITDYFNQLLTTAQAITDPFEQALFVLVQLPYLQAFDDVNKRVSRLAANIPLIKHNLLPLSFTDLPQAIYTEAILAVYEQNRVEPLKEVFIWAYERSAEHYQVVRQTLGEPDQFRFRYREALKEVVAEVVNHQLSKSAAYQLVKQWAQKNIPAVDQAEFREKAELELLSLHEGNFARYRIRPGVFAEWWRVWEKPG